MALMSALRRGAALTAVLSALSAAPTTGAASAKANVRAARAQAKAEFVNAMNEPLRAEAQAKVKAEAKDRMRDRILSKAVPMPASAKDGVPDFLKVDTGVEFSGKYAAKAAPKAAAKASPPRKLEEGDEDEDEERWEGFGFDPADYAIKYIGCSNIAMYSDENADEGDTVFQTKHFIVFRLCPSYSCGSYGCDSNYGEYVVSLDEYLEAFAQFKEEQFEAYCQYCETCMYFEEYFYGHRDLEEAVEGDDAVEEGDDAVEEEGDDAAAAEYEGHACKYYDECVDYLKTCDYDQWREANGYDDDAYAQEDEEDFDIREFLECQQVDDQYGYYSYYIAPTCADDGETIEFGIFSDEYCGVNIGEDVDIYDFLSSAGVDLSEDVLADYIPEDCLSCKESELPYMVALNDQNDEDDISELCEQLYMGSGKCNTMLYGENDESYMSYNQAANSEKVCTFIETILSGSYDSNGYIIIDEDEFSFDQLSFGELTEASNLQIVGILLFAVGIVALLIWSCFLHRAVNIQSKTALLPPAEDLERRESGIGMCRSTSREMPDHVIT